MKKYILYILFVSLPIFSEAQMISGIIYDQNNQTLPGVTIRFLETPDGTVSDKNGAFVLMKKTDAKHLILSFIGFKADTILLDEAQNFLKFKLREGVDLQEITVKSARQSASFSLLNPINLETLGSQDFRKAACCSLSESFQGTNTVDLTYTNAATGNREIQFLGLRGLYTQNLIENRPVFGGILSSQSYDYIPGTWLEQINILKGAGTSIYGIESITGAINTSLKKPETDHRFFANVYADGHERAEVNLHLNHSWNIKQHSGIYAHYSQHQGGQDHNKDGFYDDPLQKKWNVIQRNTLLGTKFEGHLQFQAFGDKKEGGAISSEKNYRTDINTHFAGLSGNLGYVGFEKKTRTLGSIWDLSYSKIDGEYGRIQRKFDANELRFLSNIIYNESYDDNHFINIGGSVQANFAEENLNLDSINTKFDYKEITTAINLEYNFQSGSTSDPELKKFIATITQRVDWIKTEQWFLAPRLNVRYNLVPELTLRFSVGRGYRLPRILADNLQYLATNYSWNIQYDAKYESAWNYGLNFVYKPSLKTKAFTLNIDAYYTDFENQLVADVEYNQNEGEVYLYNLKNKSSALHLATTLSTTLVKGLEVKTGGKYVESIATYWHGTKQVPLTSRWRAFSTIDYSAPNQKWSVSVTGTYTGSMRLAEKNFLPIHSSHNHTGTSPGYFLVNSQLNYSWKNWEFYGGVENITGYTQHDAIISASDPSASYFNAIEQFAPTSGIKPYLGFRYKLNHFKKK